MTGVVVTLFARRRHSHAKNAWVGVCNDDQDEGDDCDEESDDAEGDGPPGSCHLTSPAQVIIILIILRILPTS